MKPIKSMIADAIVQFRKIHGFVPTIVADTEALIVAVTEGKLTQANIRLVDKIDQTKVVKPGEGSCLALTCIEMPGGRTGLAVVEYRG